MQGRAGQQLTSPGKDAVDIRVVAFAGPRAHAVQGLQELFGVDRNTATQLVDSVPVIVRRGVSTEEAQSYVAALQRIGAQVSLERSGTAQPVQRPAPPANAGRRPQPPPSPRARGGPPPPPPHAMHAQPEENAAPASDLPLPKPILRPPSADLEFDVLGQSAGAAADLPRAQQANDVDLAADLGGSAGSGNRSGRRQEIELDSGTGAASLDIDTEAAAPRFEPAAREPEPSAEPQAEPAAVAARPAGMRTMRNIEAPDAQRGPPMSRAEVIQHAQDDAPRDRSLPLLQLLAALIVCIAGIKLDSSVFFGNASLLSVVVHGLALQQFGYGIWGLLRGR